MIIYRPHRRTLAEAMQEAREFPTLEAMKEYIVQESKAVWGTPMFAVDDIVLGEESVTDERNGWKDTRYVCVKRMGNEDYMEKFGCPQCIGMCATDYPGKPADEDNAKLVR